MGFGDCKNLWLETTFKVRPELLFISTQLVMQWSVVTGGRYKLGNESSRNINASLAQSLSYHCFVVAANQVDIWLLWVSFPPSASAPVQNKMPKGKELVKKEEITLSPNCSLLNRLVHIICRLFVAFILVVVRSCKYSIKIIIPTLFSFKKRRYLRNLTFVQSIKWVISNLMTVEIISIPF